MRIYTFRCSNSPDLFAISRDPAGENLPPNICSGRWVRHSETEANDGDPIAGFVSRDVFRDLHQQGYHLASGVRVTVSRQGPGPVDDALSSANLRTGFFTTDRGA